MVLLQNTIRVFFTTEVKNDSDIDILALLIAVMFADSACF